MQLQYSSSDSSRWQQHQAAAQTATAVAMLTAAGPCDALNSIPAVDVLPVQPKVLAG
jgi:hypothetical protein